MYTPVTITIVHDAFIFLSDPMPWPCLTSRTSKMTVSMQERTIGIAGTVISEEEVLETSHSKGKRSALGLEQGAYLKVGR